MNIFLIFAFVFAVLEAVALQKDWFKLEVIAKPGVMIALFIWLYTSAGHVSRALGGAEFGARLCH